MDIQPNKKDLFELNFQTITKIAHNSTSVTMNFQIKTTTEANHMTANSTSKTPKNNHIPTTSP